MELEYQYFSNKDFIIEIYDGLYIDNMNNLSNDYKYLKVITSINNSKIICNNTIIDLNILNKKEYYYVLNNINEIILEYDSNKIKINFEKKYKNIIEYYDELNIILLGLLKNFDYNSNIKDLNDIKKKFRQLVNIRKIIGKFKRFCFVKNILFNYDIDKLYLKLLKNTKNLLNYFNNQNYYYTEIKKIIINSKCYDKKYSINIINKNMFLLDKIFKDYENNIKKFEEPIQKLLNDFKNNDSLEQYYSPISQTNWLDSLCENQFVGLIIRTKLDINFIFNKNIDNVDIINITRSTIDLDMFFSFMEQYYNKVSKYDDTLDEPLIKGNAIGDGNCLLPIYIHKLHWKLSKKFIPLFTALATTLNPGLYIRNSLYIYHKVMLNMLKETFKNNILDDKWINMLFTIIITTIKVNKMCDKINLDEFIDEPSKRLYNYIPSITQLLSNFIIYGIEIYKNDKNKFIKLCEVIFEECARRKLNMRDSFNKNQFINVMNNNFSFIKINNNYFYFNEYYFLINTSILMIILFDKLCDNNIKEFIKNFIDNGSLLTIKQLDIIKNFVKENNFIFEFENDELYYLINPQYQHHQIYSADKIYHIKTINKIINKYLNKELINDKQLKSLIIQNNIQCTEKSRRIAIEKIKYFNPFLFPDKVLINCYDYYKKRIIYENIKNIKTKEDFINSDFYKLYQNNEYKNELDNYIKIINPKYLNILE